MILLSIIHSVRAQGSGEFIEWEGDVPAYVATVSNDADLAKSVSHGGQIRQLHL